MTTILTKTAKTGIVTLTTEDGVHITAHLDGKQVGEGRMSKAPVKGMGTRWIACGKVLLTDEEHEAAAAACREIFAARPRKVTREALVAACRAASDDWSAARQSFIGSDGCRPNRTKEAEAAMEAAYKALADYDAAHPEETARREAANKAKAERAMWQ